MIGLDDFALAAFGAGVACVAAKYYDAYVDRRVDYRAKVDTEAGKLFTAKYDEVAWVALVDRLKEQDNQLDEYLLSLGNYWATAGLVDKVRNKCTNEIEKEATLQNREGTGAGVASASWIPRFGESWRDMASGVLFKQDLEGKVYVANREIYVEASNNLAGFASMFLDLGGRVCYLWKSFDRARISHGGQLNNPEDGFALKVLELIPNGHDSREWAEKIVAVDRELHHQIIRSDQRNLHLRIDLLKKRAFVLQKMHDLVPDSGENNELQANIVALTVKLKSQSDRLKEQKLKMVTQHALGYGLHFAPGLLLCAGLVAALVSPFWMAAFAPFWVGVGGCVAGLAWGMWRLYQFHKEVSADSLSKQFKQPHASVFSRFSSEGEDRKPHENVYKSVNAFQDKIKRKMGDLGGSDESTRRILDSILAALNVCGVFAGSWRDALWVVRDELLKADAETQQDCRAPLLDLYAKAREADSRDTFKEGLWGKACTFFGRDRFSKKERALELKRTAPDFKDEGLLRALAEFPLPPTSRAAMAGA